MGSRQGLDSTILAKFFGGLGVALIPVVVWAITSRIFFALVGVGVLGLYYAINAIFSIGDHKNEWE